jgi:hypothetical protein
VETEAAVKIISPPWRTVSALTLLFLADLGLAGQGLFSIVVGAIGCSVMTARAIWAGAKIGRGPVLTGYAIRAGLYVALAAAAVSGSRFHQATAEKHAAWLIDACRAYQARNGTLPERLALLVPDFLPSIPRAKYTLEYGEFTYSAAAGQTHTLMYVTLPPFGRRVYHFEDARWSRSE